jgi:hypothetical protein
MPNGYQPRSTPDAQVRIITVRMPGDLHAQLCDARRTIKRSINDLAVEGLRMVLTATQETPPVNVMGSDSHSVNSADTGVC